MKSRRPTCHEAAWLTWKVALARSLHQKNRTGENHAPDDICADGTLPTRSLAPLAAAPATATATEAERSGAMRIRSGRTRRGRRPLH